MYQVCDIDGLVKVSPYAILYIFRISINLTRLRSNTWIIHHNEKQKVHKLTEYECRYYPKLNAYVRQFEVKYPLFGTGSLAIVKNDRHEEPGRTKYLFTNDLSLTNREFVLRYRSRWHIEIVFMQTMHDRRH